ncbi:DUF4296 domain-containing protein [Salibacter halophilus]|uniref:DUF4296 domain-containing protein n=1 Tax=Salibacter halophilus TaxID=1803916 RepID=A0A6N6M4V1_9FLAO|nr:DUF4296 domain-containing protein [Salibacter halophilus]KAB1062841.1 DUF4296 domain-containing protein [Salibacter halophilus]
MRNFLFIAFISLISFGCSSDEEKATPPNDIIQQEQMVQILTDIQIAEAIYQRGNFPKDDYDGKKYVLKMYQKIFEKYEIDEQKFKQSLTWYEEHPKILADVYDEVLNELSQREANLRDKRKAKNKEKKKDN